MNQTRTLLLALGASALPLSATIIGTEDFTYTDGAIDGAGGGTGWEWNQGAQNQTNTGGQAIWEYPGFGDAADQTITSNQFITGQSLSTGGAGGSLRRFGQDRGNAAFQANGKIFYKVEMTRSASSVWSGLSHMDFGNERVKFGVPFENAGTDTIGIETTNTGDNGVTDGTIDLVDGTTYTMVCVLDFDNDKLGLFIDPSPGFWTSGGTNNADVVRTFTNTNWASDVRLGSEGDTTWDNLVVANSATDVGLVDFIDADGDGLPADWENANGLNDNDNGSIDADNGAGGDPDNDGLTNIQEFNGGGLAGFSGGTDPRDPDSDGDFLDDGDEVNTYSSDPLDKDTDNDELEDEEEVNGFFTDPTLADTDGGGTNDGTEVALGTDPTTGNGGDDPASNGTTDFIGLELFDYQNGSIDGRIGGDGFDVDNLDQPDAFTGHTGITADWDNLFGDPQVFCQRLRTQNSGALRQFNGLGEGNAAGSSEASGAIMVSPPGTQANSVFWVKFDMTRSSGAVWSGLSLYSYGSEEAFIGVPGGQAATDELGFEEPGVGSVGSGLFLTDGDTNTIVARVDPAGGNIDIFLNPNLAGSEPNPFDPLPAGAAILGSFVGTDITAIRCASGGNGPTDWDNICVAGTWAGLSTPPIDGLSNGLRDSFEAGFNVFDPSGNPDGDGFTNLQEQDNATNPNEADTDFDGLNDDKEVTGADNTVDGSPTDPCNPDSDGDGIDDGDEISGAANTVNSQPTNPNAADTDGDQYGDLLEINNGFDPTDAGSNPGAAGIVLVDGSLDPLYGPALAVQTINSAFDFNELDAAYAQVSGGKLYLMITGNLQDNFNKLEIFFDTGSAVSSNVFNSAGNDGANNMDGMTFDAALSPDYHIILRRGNDGSSNKFDLDIGNLATDQSDFYGSVFGDAQTGSASTPTGTVNLSPIVVAHDDSNSAGIGNDQNGSAADQVAAAAVTTGIELCIDLADLGNPSGSLRIMALINNDQHNFLSNQSLGGLPVGTGNLAGPAGVNFDALAGDQFFTVAIPAVGAGLGIEFVSYDGTTIVVNVTGAEAGKTYDITSSTILTGFAPTGVIFTSATATGISIPANATLNPALYFRAEEQSP